MAKTYTARIPAQAWKQHTCVQCGCVYTYLMRRTVTGQATTAEMAQQRAQANVIPTLQAQVDQQPCPTCGLYQPDMVGHVRGDRHKIVFWLSLIAFVILIILRPSYAVQANTLTIVCLIAAAIAVALYLLIDSRNPNADPSANRKLAEERVRKGEVKTQPGKSGTPMPDKVSPPRSAIHTAALGLLVIGLALIAMPEIVRALQHWPANADSYPPVAGPGDHVRIYMDQKIHSIKGYWRGNPQVQVIGPNGAVSVSAGTNSNNWGTSIRFKSSESDSSSTPWLEFSLPEDPSLAGRQVKCDLSLDVVYPKKISSGVFDEQESKMHRAVTLQLGPAGAGATYNSYWWIGTAGGFGLIIVCGLIILNRARAMARLATPSQIFPVQTAPPAMPVAAVPIAPPPIP